MALDETAFRALLDARGVLEPAHYELAPSPSDAFTVFAQRHDARVELAEWRRHAGQFHGIRLGLTVDKKYDDGFPSHDVARVVLAPLQEKVARAGAPGTRTCWGRPRTSEDLRMAREIETAGAGLADLAARCTQVWLVAVECEGDAESDLVALRLAAILAGVVLGPILAPRGAALFGPKTARVRLG